MRALALEHLHSNPIGVYGDVLADRGIGAAMSLIDACALATAVLDRAAIFDGPQDDPAPLD